MKKGFKKTGGLTTRMNVKKYIVNEIQARTWRTFFPRRRKAHKSVVEVEG